MLSAFVTIRIYVKTLALPYPFLSHFWLITLHKILKYRKFASVKFPSSVLEMFVKCCAFFLLFTFGNGKYTISTAKNRTIASNCFIYNRIPKSGSTTTSKIISDLQERNNFTYLGKIIIQTFPRIIHLEYFKTYFSNLGQTRVFGQSVIFPVRGKYTTS